MKRRVRITSIIYFFLFYRILHYSRLRAIKSAKPLSGMVIFGRVLETTIDRCSIFSFKTVSKGRRIFWISVTIASCNIDFIVWSLIRENDATGEIRTKLYKINELLFLFVAFRFTISCKFLQYV